MTKDEIAASGAPHSGIRLTSPLSKEVAPSAVELLQLADQQAYMRARYNEEDSGLIRESQVIEWALRQAVTPAVGIREALAQWLENEAAQYGDSDTIVYSPRNVANILATQAARLRSSALSSTTAERGAGRASIIQECADVVGEMRQSEAGIFDAKHSGQRGEDRSNALYDAYQAIRALSVSHP